MQLQTTGPVIPACLRVSKGLFSSLRTNGVSLMYTTASSLRSIIVTFRVDVSTSSLVRKYASISRAPVIVGVPMLYTGYPSTLGPIENFYIRMSFVYLFI